MRFSQCCALIPEGCPVEYYSERFELQKNTGQTKKARSVHFDPRAPRLGLNWSTDAAKSKLEYLIALGARIGTVQVRPRLEVRG